jgi:hypothetical protein
VESSTRTVAINRDVPGAERWDLESRQFDDAMRDELRDRAETLARGLADGEAGHRKLGENGG